MASDVSAYYYDFQITQVSEKGVPQTETCISKSADVSLHLKKCRIYRTFNLMHLVSNHG